MADAIVCFYKASTLPSLAVRLDTQRPGQPLDAVPSHVAIILPVNGIDTLYEMISTGWRKRLPVLADYAWSAHVPLPEITAAISFAMSCAGERYDWDTIAVLALAKFVPDAWLKTAHLDNKRICSWFVERVLVSGGWAEPAWAARQYITLCPNDLSFAVRE